MKVIPIVMLVFLTSCSGDWLGIADDVFDNAVTVQIQKEAVQSNSDVKISVEITNK